MPRKVRKIRRKPGQKRNMYFTADTQEAIVKYQNAETDEEKQALYLKEIYPAFDKLVENLIFVYGFKTSYDTFTELKSDCVSFLYESLYKWSPEKGTKAFSYYNVVAKNWLIIRSRQQQKRVKRHVSIDSPKGLTPDQARLFESYDVMPAPDEILISRNLRNEIQILLKEIEKCVSSETEKTCISAIQTVFKNVDELDFLNKRAILIYVRDISGLSPKQLSVAMSSIRKHYRRLTKGEEKFNLFF
tara:strand:- start:318 stop:1052 length:735 start_codon:yes stop_codon:yes gene_type:complete